MPAFDIACLRFDALGLIPAIAQGTDGEVLMLAWMNAESLAETLRTGQVTYWSRSRGALWRKGETSGHVQRLEELRVDCDRDCLLLIVEQTGPACHTNRPNCFFTAVREGEEVILSEPERCLAGQSQPFLLAEEGHAQLPSRLFLRAGSGTGDDVVGLGGDRARDLGAEGFGASLGFGAGHSFQRTGEDDGLAGDG